MTGSMTGVVICGGTINDYDYMKRYFEGAGLIVAADSGAHHCKNFSIIPDIMAGDFDSVNENDFSRLASAGVEIIRFPVEKDKTDSELAAEIAAERGSDRIILMGAVGTRLDHSISTVFLLKKLLDRGIEGIIVDERNEIRLIKSSIEIVREDRMYVTLLPLAGDAKGVSTRGLYYPLKNATLETGSSRGVSNEFCEDRAFVSVEEGYLLVIKAKE